MYLEGVGCSFSASGHPYKLFSVVFELQELITNLKFLLQSQSVIA